MRKLLFLMSLLSLFLVVSAVQAQEPPSAIYFLLYGTENQQVQIAALYPNAEWRLNTIPGRFLYAQTPVLDAGMIMPYWSNDGQKVYVTQLEPNTDTIATQVMVFYPLTGLLDNVAQVIDQRFVEEKDRVSEFVSVDSVSPDDQYVWATRLLTGQNLLINTSTHTFIEAPTGCPARVLEWLWGEVLVSCTSAQFSQPAMFTLDLASGQRIGEVAAPPPNASDNPFASYIYAGKFLRTGRFMVGAFNSSQPSFIGVLQLNNYQATYFEVGTFLELNDRQDYAAYFSGGRLKRLNMTSLRVSDVGAGITNNGTLWEGNTLSYWQTQERNGLYEVIRVETSPLRHSEHRTYQGQAPTNISFAPHGEGYALEFQPGAGQAYVEVYKGSQLVWVSDFEYPNSYVTLQTILNDPISWTSDGEWVHLNYAPSLSVQSKTISVNVESGESVAAPEERATYMGESPDGAWWLYSSTTEVGRDQKNRLFVSRRGTQEYVVLNEGQSMFYNLQLPEWASYQWSPVVSD